MREKQVVKTEEFTKVAVEMVSEAIQKNPEGQPFHLFLSGGSTPKAIYSSLVECDIDWSLVHLWWGDERFVPPDHPDSNFKMVKECLIDYISIPSSNLHPWPILSSPELSADTYNHEFKNVFEQGEDKLNFQLLGMGDDGHTASLFPETEALAVVDKYCVANPVPGKESCRLTLTYPALALSERVVFLVKGAGKKSALKEVYEESKHPASKVVAKSEPLFLVDDSAASLLT